MGIVRTVEWKLKCTPPEAEERIREALVKQGMEVAGDADSIKAKSSRSIRKNRWASELQFDLEPMDGETLAVAKVDMLGNKHYELLSEIAEQVGDDLFDDRGVSDAVERLGKMGRLFGRKEVRHLHHLLHGNERVLILGQGNYERKQGLIALTTERLFFFEKSLMGQETIEEFNLKAITSLQTGKKMTGEKLVVNVSGNQSEITGMIHGQADEIVRRFRKLRGEQEAPQAPAPAAPAPAAPAPTDDPLAQLERLADLRERGIINDDEFEQKKAELMKRI